MPVPSQQYQSCVFSGRKHFFLSLHVAERVLRTFLMSESSGDVQYRQFETSKQLNFSEPSVLVQFHIERVPSYFFISACLQKQEGLGSIMLSPCSNILRSHLSATSELIRAEFSFPSMLPLIETRLISLPQFLLQNLHLLARNRHSNRSSKGNNAEQDVTTLHIACYCCE